MVNRDEPHLWMKQDWRQACLPGHGPLDLALQASLAKHGSSGPGLLTLGPLTWLSQLDSPDPISQALFLGLGSLCLPL